MPPARRVAAIGATARYTQVSFPLMGQLHPQSSAADLYKSTNLLQDRPERHAGGDVG